MPRSITEGTSGAMTTAAKSGVAHAGCVAHSAGGQ